jgi:hypothetical protein
MNAFFKSPTFTLRALCALFLFAGPLAAAEDEVEQLQTAFEKRHGEANAKRDEQLDKLEAGYQAALNRHIDKVKASGNLEDVLTLRDEVDAVREGVDPLPALPATATQEFKQLRKTFEEARAVIEKAHATTVTDLATKMSEALKTKEVQYTKAGRIDEALEARKMREALESDEGVGAARGRLSDLAPAKAEWSSLLGAEWEIEFSESWYVGDALGLKGKGIYPEESKALMLKVPDGGFPHFIGVPKAKVVFKLPSKVTRFEAKVSMISFGDASLILHAGGKKVAEVRVDGQNAKEALLKAEFDATNRLTLEFDPQGTSAGDWIGIFSPKIR